MDGLCQDCLRGTRGEICECGGDVCGCNDCREVLQLLEDGCRDWKRLGLRSSIDGLSWSKSQGLERR